MKLNSLRFLNSPAISTTGFLARNEQDQCFKWLKRYYHLKQRHLNLSTVVNNISEAEH